MTEAVLPLHAFGPEDAPAVVCLHGFLGSGADWLRIAEQLAPDFRVVAPDLPGHGQAIGLPEETYGMEGAAQAVLQTLDHAGIERASLLGYSMGGRLALFLALKAPERFSHLVLESASPGLESEHARAERQRLDAVRADAVENDFSAFLDGWYRMPLFRTLAPSERQRLVRERASSAPAELARSLRAMGTGTQPDLWPRLASLSVPTLALAGALDAKFVEIAKRMEAASPQITAHVIPEAGHNVHLERPEAFAGCVRRFMEEIPCDDPG